jgi:ketosteroid isomerase-like protein
MANQGHWIDDLFAAIDGKDQVAFAEFFALDGTFRFGNHAPVHGRRSIRDAVAEFFVAVRGLDHRVEERWLLPDTAIVTGVVSYTRHDGGTLTVPFANVMKLENGAIRDYRIFVDNSTLFAAPDVVGLVAQQGTPEQVAH